MMNKQTTDIVAYLTPIGLVIALLAGDRYASRFHLNQALVIQIASIVFGIIGHLPLIGGIISAVGTVLCVICGIIGFISAIIGVERPIPVIGEIHLL